MTDDTGPADDPAGSSGAWAPPAAQAAPAAPAARAAPAWPLPPASDAEISARPVPFAGPTDAGEPSHPPLRAPIAPVPPPPRPRRQWLGVAVVAALIGAAVGAGVTALADNGNGSSTVTIHESNSAPGAAVAM